MFRQPIPRFAVLAAVVAAVLAPATACSDPAVSPLPARPPSVPLDTSPSGLPVGSPPPPSTPAAVPTTRRDQPTRPRATKTSTPPRSAPPSTTGPSTCEGAIRYDLDLATTELALLKSLCFATGAVLRIQGIGPGEVTVDRADLVSQHYEGGVVDIRFVRPGTVAVRIPQGGEIHTITVVIR